MTFVVGQQVKFKPYADGDMPDDDPPSPLITRMNAGESAEVVNVVERIPNILIQVEVELDGERKVFAHYFLDPS